MEAPYSEPGPAPDTEPDAGPDPNPDPGHYPPRVCRICLETVLPTFQPSDLPGFLAKPQVVYESSDPTLGRLLRPCKCRGSSRYVHEACLQSWRHADPGYGKRNYWQCPTCGFQYRLGRLTWARWISSAFTQLLLTLAILLLAVFLLGFVADPIIDLYLDRWDLDYADLVVDPSSSLDPDNSSWFQHFVKGLASLGVLSILKVAWAASPWYWNVRATAGVMTSTNRSTGRSRFASLGWLMIVIGVGTFLWAVYKGVRSWSKRTLEKAGEKVMDVPLPDEDDVQKED
ncbi:hypothetical protein N7510_006896 [Penicillium lagena]|uniref:uncharacterized protein n=1 Tax=Penicillium lagena TaxID=94218 RepID=UPI002541BA60|nr:uncharacterized protein N7510_006896 [Penicillium lagena]KAJ5610177.1 hypothetical protein N7510_006896 [Penicillium lagena]